MAPGSSAPSGILRFSHVGLCVSDLDRAARFYGEVLGFRRLSQIEIGGQSVARLLGLEDVLLRAVYLERDGFRLELLHYALPGHAEEVTPRPMNRIGLTHLSLRVRALDALLEVLRKAGVEVLESRHLSMPGIDAGAVFIVDPDGTLIELVESPGDPELVPGQR